MTTFVNYILSIIGVRLKPFFIRYAEMDRNYSFILQYCIRYAEEIFIIAIVLQYVTLFLPKICGRQIAFRVADIVL